jgi:hypothetical protein
MRYYKQTDETYLIGIGTGSGGTEITAEEYASIMAVIVAKPTPPEGYDYKLTATLTWEQYELPIPTEDEDATEADYLAALAELGVAE